MKIFVVTLLLLPFLSYGQSLTDTNKFAKDTLVLSHLPIDSTGTITYKFIGEVKGVGKSDFYTRAKIWAAVAFNNAKNVTQLDDEASGSLIIKAISEQSYSTKTLGMSTTIPYYLHFTVHFSFKEGKYRVLISNFSVEVLPSSYAVSGSYSPESRYDLMKQWNQNAKTGNMEYNRSNVMGKSAAKAQIQVFNNIDLFATNEIEDIKKALSKPAKADDF